MSQEDDGINRSLLYRVLKSEKEKMKKRCVYEPVFLRLRPNPTIEGSLADPRKKPVLESMRTGSLPGEYDVTFVERALALSPS